METQLDTAEFRVLLESATSTISDFSIGFVLPVDSPQGKDGILGGSGTLVTIGKLHGILTARHVVERLNRSSEVGLILPSRFSPAVHQLVFKIAECQCFTFNGRGDESEGPDLALLLPPEGTLSSLRAKKSFYNISKREARMRNNAPFLDRGFWILEGIAGEWTTDAPTEMNFSRVKVFRGVSGAVKITKSYEREDFDYLICEALYNEYYEGPEDFGGFSGGGLWQFLVEPQRCALQISEYILSGVAFYQSSKMKNDAGQKIREIMCHGRNSLYGALVSLVGTA